MASITSQMRRNRCTHRACCAKKSHAVVAFASSDVPKVRFVQKREIWRGAVGEPNLRIPGCADSWPLSQRVNARENKLEYGECDDLTWRHSNHPCQRPKLFHEVMTLWIDSVTSNKPLLLQGDTSTDTVPFAIQCYTSIKFRKKVVKDALGGKFKTK